MEHEQLLQQLRLQRQHFQSTLLEIEAALAEIKTTNESYQIVGNLLIKKEPAKVQQELLEKQKTIKLRLESIEKQEQQVKQQGDQHG